MDAIFTAVRFDQFICRTIHRSYETNKLVLFTYHMKNDYDAIPSTTETEK